MDNLHPLTLGQPGPAAAATPADWLLPLVAAVAASLAVVVRAYTIASGGDESIVQAIPDDAFYYIVLAKHFAASLGWTFDGVRSTTGFHLLWAYLLAGFYSAWPEATLQQTFAFAAGVACVCHAAAAYLVTRALGRGFAAATASTLVFSVGGVPATATFCMESPLLTLAAAATCAVLAAPRSQVLQLLAVGATGSLCRTDYIILPAAFAVAQFPQRRAAAWCVLGAAVGVLLVAAHSFAISGALAQASAATKVRWSQLMGHDLRPALYALGLVLDTRLLPRSNIVAQVVTCGCACVGLLLARKQPERLQLALTGVLATLAYLAVYTYNAAAVQPWYATSFAVPVLLVVWSLLAPLQARSLLPLMAALSIGAAVALLRADHAWWPHQRGPMLAGQLLATQQLPGSTAAWNAGVLSYFSGGRIVNLDGLVNDEIDAYARKNELLEYLAKRDIRTIADWGAMLGSRAARKRGGYDTQATDACITKVSKLKDGPRWYDSELNIYQVDAGCIRGAQR